ncbi:NADH:ubiquinone reductase (Na(+)-transporting) subunit D [Rhizobium aegyptiacum]|uniref:NADH:ubiquinone reductase (Na(+)-transporting) subunit D n=1 Tax=Rhizobium aegyptiacum TaxID=1764550 RepID=UPI0007E53B57|nr:NADH:ubiquinone reductase (Na(+)-transporting) subunit D [Rhizobium aegyptiacum]
MNGVRLHTLTSPLINENAITAQILGLCIALAVTRTLATALIMSAAVISVLVLSSSAISLIRNHIPKSIRLIVQLTIIASLVIVVDQVLRAYAFEVSRVLSVYVGLIVTNCLIFARVETFAMNNRVTLSALDALGNGLGYGIILVTIGSVRELLGTGQVLGRTVLHTAAEGGWFQPFALMLLPPSAFFLIGLLIWAIRTVKTAQIEAREFEAAQPGEVR